MKILITGVAGFIGSNFASHLTDKGYKVVGLDNLSGGFRKNLNDNVKFYKADILDTKKINKIFKKEKFDLVYHFAAYAAENLSPYIRNYNYTNNVVGSVNIINCCINYNVSKIVFASSIATMGNCPLPFLETMTPYPQDPYGIAKYCVELDLIEAKSHFGLNYNILRLHNVIGINQNIWDKYRNVIAIWIRQTIQNQPLTIFGDGKQERGFSDIEYLLSPMERLIFDHNNEIYNLGADKTWTILEAANLVQKVAKEFGYYPEIKYEAPRHEVKYAYSDHSKAKTQLQFEDKTDLENVIKKTFRWALNQPFYREKRMKYEIEKNMYESWK